MAHVATTRKKVLDIRSMLGWVCDLVMAIGIVLVAIPCVIISAIISVKDRLDEAKQNNQAGP